jgi:hypothetical protein
VTERANVQEVKKFNVRQGSTATISYSNKHSATNKTHFAEAVVVDVVLNIKFYISGFNQNKLLIFS